MDKQKETKLLSNISLIIEVLILVASIILTILKNNSYVSSLLLAGGVIALLYSFAIATKINKQKGLIIGSVFCGVLFILLNYVFNLYQDISSALMFLSLVCLLPLVYENNKNFKKGITALIILIVVGSIALIFSKNFSITNFFMFANIVVAIILFATALINKLKTNVLVGCLLLLILNAFMFLNISNTKLLYELLIVISLTPSYTLLALTNKDAYEK